jgi:hypothetical protein
VCTNRQAAIGCTGPAIAALKRLVEDEGAPCAAQVLALKQITHPPLCSMWRLLVKTSKGTKPVPSRLLAVAALAYAREVGIRKIKPVRPKVARNHQSNALGI